MVTRDIPVGIPNSFEPLPNPLMTLPLRYTGNGASGLSGPTTSGRSVGRDIKIAQITGTVNQSVNRRSASSHHYGTPRHRQANADFVVRRGPQEDVLCRTMAEQDRFHQGVQNVCVP